jgi:hypothetical protein
MANCKSRDGNWCVFTRLQFPFQWAISHVVDDVVWSGTDGNEVIGGILERGVVMLVDGRVAQSCSSET